jgi:hypothetical protein
MQFRAFEPGVEVFGASVGAFVDAFKLFPSVVLKCLVKNGIGTMSAKGTVEIDKNRWYPQEKWLAAWEEIATTVGPRACYQIGRQVPKHAVFPPTITEIHGAVASIDVAYHMNHRKGGKVMFDPATGQKAKGIGTYGYEATPGERRITSVCENPYPCDFDRGLVSEIVSKFEKNARVSHDDGAPCRTKGAASCTYVISW